ncbi:MAG: GatB/YqeY domain-containing protein [Vicinamibacteria bacterium]|nr:GatB/YqeY domain-containing protein [Vicinamibacteria bacterium]
MALIDEVSRGITEAMKSRDQDVLGTLRMLKSALTNKEIEKGRSLDAAESLQVVSMLVKQRRESIEQFTRGGRTDLADKEGREIVILERLLPPAASPGAIAEAVTAAIAETGATSAKDFGKVMKAAMATLAGASVDGKLVSEAVKAQLK